MYVLMMIAALVAWYFIDGSLKYPRPARSSPPSCGRSTRSMSS